MEGTLCLLPQSFQANKSMYLQTSARETTRAPCWKAESYGLPGVQGLLH